MPRKPSTSASIRDMALGARRTCWAARCHARPMPHQAGKGIDAIGSRVRCLRKGDPTRRYAAWARTGARVAQHVRGDDKRMGLKDQLENYPQAILTGVMVVVGSLAWTAAENMRVEPRDREIGRLTHQVAAMQHDIRELHAAHDPYRRYIHQLLADKPQRENNLAASHSHFRQWYDTLEWWKMPLWHSFTPPLAFVADYLYVI